MKLHMGCGSVYLDGWKNVDLPGPNTFLAADRPDLVAKLKTTPDAYYKNHANVTIDTLRDGPIDQPMVVDAFGSFDNIPAPYWECDELLAVHTFEHLSMTEARKALDQIDAIMKPNGALRLDVPDHDRSMELYAQTNDPFFKRHVLGPRRNQYGYHMMGYSKERLIALVEEHGFVYEGDDPREHLYPAISVRFRKPGPRAPRDYAWPPPYDVPDSWRVLDVGPGSLPLPRADAYLDHDYANLRPLKEAGKNVFIGDLMSGLPEIPDKSYDLVWASHCLEHVPSPQRAAATLSRIGKRGVVVLPSVIKESIGCFEETDHKWLILPSPTEGGPPIFVRQNSDYMQKARDTDVQKITSRLYRTGPNRVEEARYLRRWFYKNEKSLDVVHHWEGELKLQVIE